MPGRRSHNRWQVPGMRPGSAGMFYHHRGRETQILMPPSGPFGGHETLGVDLESAWLLEEASGVRVDQMENWDLSDINTVTSAAGKNNTGASFDQANTEHLKNASDVTGATKDKFSISCWYKHTADVVAGYDSQFQIGDRAGIIVYYTAPGVIALCNVHFMDGIGWRQVGTGWGSFGDGTQWHHIVAVFDGPGGDAAIYLNNVKYTSGTQPEGPLTMGGVNRGLVIGGNWTGANPNHGVQDETSLWWKRLIDGEVSDLFNDGDGLYYA